MPNALNPVITESGLAAIINATNNGLSATITHVALGNLSYEVGKNSDGLSTQTQLRSERQRVTIADGRRASDHQIDLSFIADGPEEFWVREIGFYLSDGTLLSVWSDETRALAWKSASVPLIVGLELVLATLPAESVNIVAGEVPLQLILTKELAAIGTAISNLQLEQLRQADEIQQLKEGS